MNNKIVDRAVVSLFLAAAFAAEASPAASDPKDAVPGDVVIFLVDRSESVGQLATPDTVEALVNHYVRVAALARMPTQFAVVAYSGKGVQVIGDPQGRPTLAYDALLERLEQDFPRPNGGTPLVEALQATQALVAALPDEQRVTIIHCGDGQPAGAFDPDQYPVVAKHLADCIAAVTQGVPTDQQQPKIEELRRKWRDPATPEGKRLYETYAEQEFSACKRLAAGFHDRQVRFVSVDFNGVEMLRQLHEAGGGKPQDYLLVQPASRLIEMLHEHGLTRFGGVLVCKPIVVPKGDVRQRVTAIPLDAISEAAVVTVVFSEPVADFTIGYGSGSKSTVG